MSQPQERIGERYRVLSSLRVTPVYREILALDLRERREVTLWVFEPVLVGDALAQRRFMTAARDSMQANLPGVLKLVGGGVVRGTTYLVVQPPPGDCLRVRLLRWRPSTKEVASIVGQLAAIMNAAHEKGRFHGLLTARDVLLDGDRVVVAGMGMWTSLARRPLLAALRHEATSLSPEARAPNGTLGQRSDVYAVAAICAEMLHVSTGASLTDLRTNGWNPLLVEALDRALAHGTNARPKTLAGLRNALTVRAADSMSRMPRSTAEQRTQVELSHDSEEQTIERANFLPSARLADGRPAAPPPMPRPALPRASTAGGSRGGGKRAATNGGRVAPARPRLRRATTYSGPR